MERLTATVGLQASRATNCTAMLYVNSKSFSQKSQKILLFSLNLFQEFVVLGEEIINLSGRSVYTVTRLSWRAGRQGWRSFLIRFL